MPSVFQSRRFVPGTFVGEKWYSFTLPIGYGGPTGHPILTLPALLFSVRYTYQKIVAKIPYGLWQLLVTKFHILDARPVFLPLSFYVSQRA